MSNFDYLENIKDIGGAFADDQWVYAWYQWNTGVAIGANSGVLLNLSNVGYLPNDGYDYEVLVSCYVWTGTTNGNAAYMWLFGGTSNNDANAIRISIGNCITRVANYNSCACQSCIFPFINGNRNLYYYNSAGTATGTSWGIQLGGYRRLGTNNV